MKLSIIKNEIQFTEATEFFTSSDRKTDTADYFSWVLSSISRYLAEGDVQFLNNVTLSARNMGQIRLARKVTDVVSAHSFGKTGYIGKANKKKLAANRENSDKLLAKAETFITDSMAAKEEKAKEVLTPEQVVVQFTELLHRRNAKLVKAGFTPDQVATLLRTVADELTAEPNH